MHWRGLVGNRTYFDCADLNGRDLLVQVESVKPGKIPGVAGRPETRCVLVKFAGHDRPLAFKATLAKSFVSLHGNGDIGAWPGKWIWLTSQMVNDPSAGRGALTEAVRILPRVPTEAEIAAATKARGGTKQSAEPSDKERELVSTICAEIGTAKTADELEQAIAPHREAVAAMAERSRAIVMSAKKVRISELTKQENAQ